MGKVRTKSRFYNHDSNTIGNITNLLGGDIDVTDISLNEVYDKLFPFGISINRNIQTVVKSSNVNKWAAFRPYSTSYDNSWGWGYNTSTHQLIEYHKRNDNTNLRLGDFAGYNHNAEASGLVHNPASNIFGENYTTSNTNDIPSNFGVGFKLNEVSPSDVFNISFNDLRMFVLQGTTSSSTILSSKDLSDYNTSHNTLWIDNVPRGFTGYGSRTFSVWWGSKTFNIPTVRWRFGSEVNNEFTLTVKSFFNYHFTTVNLPTSTNFNMSIQNETFVSSRPSHWTSTIGVSSNITLGMGDRIDIHANNSGSWTLVTSITGTIPNNFTINWQNVFGSNQNTNENDWYNIRATFVSGSS